MIPTVEATLLRHQGANRPGVPADEPEDYMPAQAGKRWQDGKHAAIPFPMRFKCRCGIMLPVNSLCSVCQTPAVVYVTRTGAGVVDRGPRRTDTVAMIAVTVLFLVAIGMVMNSISDSGPRPSDPVQTMEAS